MKINRLIAKWKNSAPYFQSTLRIVAAVIFILAGTMKLFAFPQGIPPAGGIAPVFSQIWIGGVLEVVGGGLFLVGLYTRPVAFILAGEMAVAYFQFHYPQGFWPNLNGGVSAVIYCFIFLYFSSSGAGPWSMDGKRNNKLVQNAE